MKRSLSVSSPSRGRPFKPQLEQMDDRSVPAVIVVNTLTDDPLDPGTTLREAIALSANNSKGDTITFGGLAGTINLQHGQLVLSDVLGDVTVDGGGNVTIDA